MRAQADRYDAFISYSHQADKVLAKALQSELEKFARPWYRPRALRVFRDETSLAMTPQLWSTIEDALARSEWFVLMASRASAASPWVSKEVEWWLTHKSANRMLLALTDGDIHWSGADFDWRATTALPPTLARRFGEEPLWVDLRRLVPQHPTAATAPSSIALGDLVAEFAAPIRNRPKDSLIGAHLRLGRRIRRLIVGTVVVLALLSAAAVTAAVIANQQRVEAERQARIAKSQQLAANVDALLPTQLDLAQLLAVRAYRIDRNRQTEMSLLRASNASPALVRYGHFGTEVTALAASADGRTAVIGTADGEVATWDLASGARRTGGKLPGPVTSVAASGDGAVVAAAAAEGATVWAGAELEAKPLPKPVGRALAVAVSPSGRLVALSGGPPSVDRDGARQLAVIDRVSGKGRKAATAVWPGVLAMPTEAELVVADGIGTSERRATADLIAEGPAQAVYLGAHPGGTGMSANGSFFGVQSGGTVQIMAATGDVAAREQDGDLFGRTENSESEALAISADGSLLATAQAGRLVVARTTVAGQFEPSPTVHTGNRTISQLAFAGDADRLLSVTDSTVALWDLGRAQRPGLDLPTSIGLGCFGCAPPRVLLSPDGRRALVGSDLTVAMRDLDPAGSEVRLAAADDGFYKAVGWSADGSKWYVQAPDGTLETRSTSANGAVVARSTSLAEYFVAALVDDGRRAVTTTTEGVLELRDVTNGSLVRRLHKREGDYNVFVSEGKVFVEDETATTIDLATGRSTRTGQGRVTELTHSNGHLIIQREGGVLEIWNADGTRLLHSLPQGRDYQGISPTFDTPPSVGGGRLLQQRSNGELTVRDVEDGTVLGTLPGTDYAKIGLAMSPDGQRVIAAVEGSREPRDGTLAIWSLDPESLAATACRVAGRDLTEAERQAYLAPLATDTPTCAAAEPATVTGPTDPKAQAERTATVLQQMNGQRRSIRTPIDSAAQCAGDLETHSQALTDAGAAREYLAFQLADVDMTALPQGALLKNRMRAALNLSSAVDREFATWATDLKGRCTPGSTTTNPHYQRALALSRLASMEKREVSRLWSAIARTYGYRQWKSVEL